MDVTGGRIKEARESMGWSLEQLGIRVGLSKVAVLKYETGDISRFTMEKMQKFARALGVDVIWLLGLTDEPRPQATQELKAQTRWIPLLGTIAAGKPLYAIENIETYLPVQNSIPCSFALHVKGDSMTGACIPDGSIVICREQDDVENGQVAVCIIDGEEATLKRVFRHEGGIVVLRSENPAYQDMVFTAKTAKQVSIKGLALHVISEVR